VSEVGICFSFVQEGNAIDRLVEQNKKAVSASPKTAKANSAEAIGC